MYFVGLVLIVFSISMNFFYKKFNVSNFEIALMSIGQPFLFSFGLSLWVLPMLVC